MCSVPFPLTGAQLILSLTINDWDLSGNSGRSGLAEKAGDARLRHGDRLGLVGAMYFLKAVDQKTWL